MDLHDNISIRRLLVSLSNFANVGFQGLLDYTRGADRIIALGTAAQKRTKFANEKLGAHAGGISDEQMSR